MVAFGKTDHGAVMGRAFAIRDGLSAAALRALAAREKKNRAARRRSAIANALDGMRRARAAEMEQQAPRDAVVRCNASRSMHLI